ncbi:HNH endonuclease [Dictyobacter arantiisoli]|uniref:HNH nuclease domain-containing protein n=1 Tax=Dictyobacter arantiisoli TaxID=2014874 RepID=A0A5A5TGT7_9CHLR|nr:HNH endonuclease signature motif containing protein [Dictyobacter arantiisoli]GCF10791.1 hypothetical protein KDI_43550 [Dictyobacter arantiisoli]
MSKILRISVMQAGEWFKDRDPEEWRRKRAQVLRQSQYTCSYCQLTCRKFMQVNHIGAEDDHRPENLETVCPACHSVMHLGINILEGTLSIFDCLPEVNNMAAIVCATRALVARDLPWEQIEDQILQRFAAPAGRLYSRGESLDFANDLLRAIQPGAYRSYLAAGKAILFHAASPWNDYPERIWRWQCLPGSRYRTTQPES